MKKSGMRGRGGAAFNTGLKWSFMAQSPNSIKYILANCEEGDPGAYNDKGILESDPFTLLEGMSIAGYATGATNGIVFIRHGHDGPINRTEKAIEEAYKVGLLGKDILGSSFSFDAEVVLTGDSYVAGEETALMESIEGKRAMPRSRPPFPAGFGVWGKPSTINNVKTLSYVPEIMVKGSEWFSSIGVNNSVGTAIVCLSGNIARPGLYEVPMGLTLGQVINDLGGGTPNKKRVKLLQAGGPLGGVLGSDSLGIHLDFDEMQQAGAILGSGGIIVADEDACAVDLTRLLVAFCQYESCGKCFPCRLGMTNMLEIIERIANFEGTQEDLKLCISVGKTMQAGSLCGHGQLGFNPVRSAFEFFDSDFASHVEKAQ
ncbi:MAG: NADH-ubiquinone oxidoreductase-F iron-sulfur binding region domain-containing protein, partial [Desulfatiglandales bacterium]|nr:NADH-ubiquinone oxidoreductase-F iron-sulfur binding region domain-containing protein [Desulfatiglandales bacterium]